MADPWAHQPRTRMLVRQAWDAGKRAPVVVLPTGGGKTRLSQSWVLSAYRREAPVVWLAHREELLNQAAATMREAGVAAEHIGIVQADRRVDPRARVLVASLQTLAARARKALSTGKPLDTVLPEARLLIADECVTADTMIGALRAEDVRVGDLVPSWTGSEVAWRRVVQVFRNPAHTLVTLHFGARVLRCTDNHPVWAEGKGYVEAGRLVEGDLCRVWGADEGVRPRALAEDLLRGVQGALAPTSSPCLRGLRGACALGRESRVAAALLGDLREQEPLDNDGAHQPRARFREDAGAQSDGGAGVARQDERDPSEDRARAQDPLGQGSCDALPPARAPRCARRGLACGAGGEDRVEGATGPLALHDRPGAQGVDDRHRGGRRQPRCGSGEGQGCTQGCVPRLRRVDRVEVHEPGRDGTFGGLCPRGEVFNFEVEGEHNYFANGVLVHNCHHLPSDEWSVVAAFYGSAFRVGLTATPVRSDGRGLGDIFDHLIVGATVRELTAAGVLCPADVIAPSRPQSELSMPVVDAYERHLKGMPGLIFTPTVPMARRIAEELNAKGVASGVITGDLAAAERKATLQGFESSALTVLISPMVLSEGFDSKRLNATPRRGIIIARGCSSWSTWRQIVGRGLRQTPGVSARCTVVDLRGAVHVHGLPDEEVEFSLEGDPVRRKTAALPAVANCKHCWWTGTPPRDRSCPRCGARFPAPEPPKVKETAMARVNTTASREEKQRYYNALIEKMALKGYKLGWVGMLFRARFGYWPNGFRYTGPQQLALPANGGCAP